MSPIGITQEEKTQLRRVSADIPPTPPDSDNNSETDKAEGDDSHILAVADIPLAPPSNPPTEVLEIDKKTPDSWLPRDPRLIRLTGKQPGRKSS